VFPSGNITTLTSANGDAYILNEFYMTTPGNLPARIIGRDFSASTGLYTFYGLLYLTSTDIGETPFSYSRYMRLDETIEFMAGELDTSVTFDAQSFAALDGNPILANLLIGHTGDMILFDDAGTLTQPTPAARIMLSWGQLWSVLGSSPFNFRWYIDDSNAFRMIHISDVLKTSGTFNLTTYKSKNWTGDKTRYSWAGEDINRFVRSIQGRNIDFIGVDIIIPELEKGESMNVALTPFTMDVLDIRKNPDEYSNAGWVLVAANKDNGDYVCRDGVATLSGLVMQNGELSIARLDDDSAASGDRPAEYSFNEAVINGSTVAVVEEKRRQVVPIYAPIRTPDEVDFNALVPCDVGDLEPVELTIPLDGTTGGATLVGIF
jgi:hypothetical protein